MRYPKTTFSINMTTTQHAKDEYEKKYKNWYQKAEELYPNYWNLSLRERMKVRDTINEAVGYSI